MFPQAFAVFVTHGSLLFANVSRDISVSKFIQDIFKQVTFRISIKVY